MMKLPNDPMLVTLAQWMEWLPPDHPAQAEYLVLQQQLTAQQETIEKVEARAATSERFRREDGFAHINETVEFAKARKALLTRAESAEQQLVETQVELTSALDVVELYHQRTMQAEQQLTAARAEASLSKLSEAVTATMTRASVLAQVKALLKQEMVLTDNVDMAKLDALQPDSSLAVISVADREQALVQAYRAGETVGACTTDDPGEFPSRSMAEARSLLHLPQEPK